LEVTRMRTPEADSEPREVNRDGGRGEGTMSDMSESTPGQWRIPGANVFRVVAPDAPHQNKRSGMCPPYEWAIVCETDPESVGGPQAAANARLIAAAKDLLAYAECRGAFEEYTREGTNMKPRELLAVLRRHGWDHDDAVGCERWVANLRRVALAKVKGAKSLAESPVP
jgi:hypothetical protein